MAGCLINKFSNIVLPWGIDVALYCLVYMYIGYVIRQKLKKGINCSLQKFFVFTVITFLMTVLCAFFVGGQNLSIGNFGKSYFFVPIGAISGCLMTSAVSILLSKMKLSELLCKLGQNTMLVYAVHVPIYQVLESLIGLLNISNIVQMLFIQLIKLCITIVVMIPIIIIFNKYFPALVGKRKKQKQEAL